MIRTPLTENDLEWKVFKHEFEQVDDAQSTLEEILTDVSEHAEDSKTYMETLRGKVQGT